MLSNAYFLAKFRFDTAENEPAKNLQNLLIFPILLTPNPYPQYPPISPMLSRKAAESRRPTAGVRAAEKALRGDRQGRVRLRVRQACGSYTILRDGPDVIVPEIAGRFKDDRFSIVGGGLSVAFFCRPQ